MDGTGEHPIDVESAEVVSNKIKQESLQGMMLDTGPEVKKPKRMIKPLPPELENMGSDQLCNIHCAVEVYNKGSETVEQNVAQYVEVQVSSDDMTITKRINLQHDLNLCQLRHFCC